MYYKNYEVEYNIQGILYKTVLKYVFTVTTYQTIKDVIYSRLGEKHSKSMSVINIISIKELKAV